MKIMAPKWGNMKAEELNKIKKAMKRVWNPPRKKRFRVILW